jgi:preprotein translocase SecF subunit
MGFRLIPDNTSFSFVKFHKIAFAITLLGVLASFAAIGINGLHFGIDFKGGTMIEVHTQGPADLARMRHIVGGLNLGETQVQGFGAADQVMVRVGSTAGTKTADAVQAALLKQYGPVTFARTEVVGPKVSGELIQGGLVAVALSVLFMAAYIWFRFEWQFALGASVAILHDVFLTVGMFALFQWEFNLAVVAALLTIVGYSMNDTVVVFDRMREMMRKHKKMSMRNIIDLSINETLARTVMVSLTTLIAITAFFFFGGEALRGFSFALIFGILVGTYSSIFVAAPVLLYTGTAKDRDPV